eukprot:TRINITY_DN3913_c0_g1_i16.p1 TRINITY_DN3913_c0_g1~~TRINITY_DN3913_c0_g1_i16.p1  ORF type:complete len:206 (-),score=55.98 TRINITY_DN3913_c0_g1_i16:159-776(-)
MKDPRVQALRVITYNPSHKNVNCEVNAPFKILCTLLRFINNEASAKTVRPKDILEDAKELLRPLLESALGDERLGTEDCDCPSQRGLSRAVDVRMDSVDEEPCAGDKTLRAGEGRDRGLADLEVGSACYMSEMLNFNFDEYDDCEEVKEEDLMAMHGEYVKTDLKGYLIEKLNETAVKDREYFRECYSYLLKQDQALAKMYLNFK